MNKKTLQLLGTLSLVKLSLWADAPLLDLSKYDWSLMANKTEFSLDICSCDMKDGAKNPAGMKATIVEPIGAISSYNESWKMPSLGISLKGPGKKQGSSRDEGLNRRYVRYIAFPILSTLNVVQDYVCFEPLSTMTLLNQSEINPIALNDYVAATFQVSRGPHNNLPYLNMVGAIAGLADCAATTFNYPLNSLKFNAGCAGLLGPGSNYGSGKATDPIMEHHALAAVVLDYMHATFQLKKTSNASFTFSPDSKIYNTECESKPFGSIIKDQYWLQLASPATWDAVRIGDFPTKHAEFKMTPKSSDDVVTIVWIKKDICAGAMKCTSSYGVEQ